MNKAKGSMWIRIDFEDVQAGIEDRAYKEECFDFDLYVRNEVQATINEKIMNGIKENAQPYIDEAVQSAISLAFQGTDIQSYTEKLVVQKFDNYLNEDIVIKDARGKATFVGSMDDYIKSILDDKLYHPVDNYGNRIVGCTTNAQTYSEWLTKDKISGIEKRIKENFETKSNRMKSIIDSNIKAEIESLVEKYKTDSLKKHIQDYFGTLGIK